MSATSHDGTLRGLGAWRLQSTGMVTLHDDTAHGGWTLNYTFHDLTPLSTYNLAILPHGDITSALDSIGVNSGKVRLPRHSIGCPARQVEIKDPRWLPCPRPIPLGPGSALRGVPASLSREIVRLPKGCSDPGKLLCRLLFVVGHCCAHLRLRRRYG